MKLRTSPVLLASILIAGCAGAQNPPTLAPSSPFPTAIPARTATAMPSATVVTLIPLISATPSPLATPSPTIRPPTATPSPSPTITRSPTPTAVPSATPATAAGELIVCAILVAPGQPGPLYAILEDSYCASTHAQAKFLVSNDYGKTWTDFPGGLPVGMACLRTINLDYVTTNSLYASTCQGLYRWAQSSWNLISLQQTESTAIVYGQSNLIFATVRTDQGGPVIRSTDGGKTWNNASTGLVHFSGVANVAIDPRSSNQLYAIIWPKYAGSYLRRGTASGSWDTMPTPLNNGQIEIGMAMDGASGSMYVTAYSFPSIGGDAKSRMQLWRTSDPARPDVKAVTWDLVYDFGENVIVNLLASGWSPQGLALYARLAPTNCISSDPKCTTIVQRSLDGAKTWATLMIK